MNDKLKNQQILQRALDLLNDPAFRERNHRVVRVITEDIIWELQKRCDA